MGEVFSVFYAVDNLESEIWDEANPLQKDKIALLAAELALIMKEN